jgi:uncharacterized protein YbjT (DUF2867 family)
MLRPLVPSNGSGVSERSHDDDRSDRRHGRVGSEIVRGLLARGDAVVALVRDLDKAPSAFGEPDGLRIRATRLNDPRDIAQAFDGIRTVFIAMGSIGIEGVLQRIAVNAAAGISSIEQVARLSALNASAASHGINQRAHDSIDQFAASTAAPYSTVRPAIFSASLLAAAHEVRTSRTWTGLAGSGRMALIDHRDVAEAALRVLTDPARWGAHHDLTGPVPMSWPEALELLSAELGEPVTFRVAPERDFLVALAQIKKERTHDRLLNLVRQAHDGIERWRTRATFPSSGGLLPLKGLDVTPQPTEGVAAVGSTAMISR